MTGRSEAEKLIDQLDHDARSIALVSQLVAILARRARSTDERKKVNSVNRKA